MVNEEGSAMVIYLEHRHGDIVYLKTDPDQNPRIVVSCRVYAGGEIVYELIAGVLQSFHYGFEISKTKNLVDAL